MFGDKGFCKEEKFGMNGCSSRNATIPTTLPVPSRSTGSDNHTSEEPLNLQSSRSNISNHSDKLTFLYTCPGRSAAAARSIP
jgi:hypothetical protein